ncbi:hypothetical protein BX070DRAFT_258061 [Coemansia spiralis]|nr:hypothetical protein BX070DRAFT_258061 [Coemansia spiralis]
MPKAVVSRTAKVFDMVAVQTNHTFESAIASIAMNENKSKVFVDLVWLLKDVSPSKDIRDASSAAANMTNKHNTEMYMREDVYEAVRTAFANEKKMDKLDSEDRRLVKKLEREFYIHGLGLDKDSRARLGEIYNRKEELKLQFNSNTNGTSSKVLFTRRELVGLSDPYVDGLKTGQVDGLLKYVIGQAPRDKEEDYLAFNSRCPENISLLQELTMLRLEKARLLGKSTHAEHMLEDQMAKTPKAVFDMLNSWKGKCRQALVENLNELSEMKKKDTEAARKQYDEFFDWGTMFYRYRRNGHAFNIGDGYTSEYFSIGYTVPAILSIYQKMLGLQIVKVDKPSAWHPDVELYEVWEVEQDKFVGHFYLDLYPREGKYPFVAAFTARSGFAKVDGSREYPIAAMVANFPKPNPSEPRLFDYGHVIEFMHEMGHVFHCLCAATKWSRLHGMNTEKDFIEIPSQIMENWCWQPSVLRQISAHYKTGKPLPDSLIKGILRNKYNYALAEDLYSVFIGLYDMAIHNTTDEVDVNETYNQMQKDIYYFSYDSPSICPVATNWHMLAGYDARYYGYLWAQIYSADMFATRFLKGGTDNVQTGMAYRKEILQPAGSRDSAVSLERFFWNASPTAVHFSSSVV